MNSPRRLYKYRTLSGEFGLTNAADVICENRMRWQSPSAFNDPFDCVPRFNREPDLNELRKWLQRAAIKSSKNIPRRERRVLIKKQMERPSILIKELEQSLDQHLKNSSVTCFSLVKNNPLMWAHYGDSHAGVMFEFEELFDEQGFVGINVQYVRERPVINPTAFRRNSVQIERAVFNKSIDWEYEQEVRMIAYRSSPSVRAFPPTCLKSVTLGLKIPRNYRDAILDMVNRRRRNLPVFQAYLNETSYQIDSKLADSL